MVSKQCLGLYLVYHQIIYLPLCYLLQAISTKETRMNLSFKINHKMKSLVFHSSACCSLKSIIRQKRIQNTKKLFLLL